MANHKSSKKRIIRNANRALINGARMGRIRTFVKKVENAIAAGDVEGAHGDVGLYIYTMEDDNWLYVAHFIYEVEYQCFLFRHKKKYK